MNTGIFKLRYHHGGKLLRTPTVRYINGSEVEYDEDVDCICYWTILGAIKYLGYDTRMAVNVYYVEEGKSLNGGLKLISDDKGVLEMANQLRKTKVVDIYVEHLNEKVSGTELPDALRQSVKDAEQIVNLVDDTCQLPRTPPTPIFDDSDVDTKVNGNENESSEDLPLLKEVLTDFSTRKRFESRLTKNDKGPLSLQKHPSLETQNTKNIQLETSDSVRSDIKKHNLVCVTSRKDEKHQPMASKEPEMKKAKRRTPEGDASALQPSKRFKHASVGSCKKFGRRLKLNADGPKHQGGEKMDNLKVAAATEVSDVQKVTEFESSIIRGVSVECTSGSMPQESSHVSEEEMKLHKEDGMGRDQKIDGLLKIEEPQSVLRTTKSPSVGIDDVACVEEMFPAEYKATEVKSSAISRLEQEGSQTMSIERSYCPRKTINIAGESGRNLHENEEQSQSICYENNPGDYQPEEGQDLPFIRSLPIWKEIESMEIFKVMPQTPHFHPLLKLKEFLREGLAVGHMVNFASLVQKTSKLTVADPRDPFITLLDVIPEFEILGFDVKAVRDRTSNLLSMNDRHGNLQHQLKESELQVKKRSDELTKINEEIDANYKMVRELKEKQALLLSRKGSKESQLSSLKVCLDVSTKELQNVKADFESLVPDNWSSW